MVKTLHKVILWVKNFNVPFKIFWLYLLLCHINTYVETQDSAGGVETDPPPIDMGLEGVDDSTYGDMGAKYTRAPNTTEIATDLAQAAVEDALNLDEGRYSTMSFHYFNHQNDFPNKRPDEKRCYDDYIRCLLSQSVRYPICALNEPANYYTYGFITLRSYCDAYLDNCRRGLRYWIAFKHGACRWYNWTGQQYSLNLFVPNILGKIAG